MRCWNCGATVRPGAKICVYCGERLAAGDGGSGAGRDRREDRGFQAPWRSRYADPDAGRSGGSQEPEEGAGSYDQPEASREESAYKPRAPRSRGREEGRGYQRGVQRGGRASYDEYGEYGEYDDEGGDERDEGYEQDSRDYSGDETGEDSTYEPNAP